MIVNEFLSEGNEMTIVEFLNKPIFSVIIIKNNVFFIFSSGMRAKYSGLLR